MLALFAMLFGTRRYEASARNEAVLYAIAAESLFKIAALLIAAGLQFLCSRMQRQPFKHSGWKGWPEILLPTRSVWISS